MVVVGFINRSGIVDLDHRKGVLPYRGCPPRQTRMGWHAAAGVSFCSPLSLPRDPIRKEFAMNDDIVIVGATRTAVGAFNGALAGLPAHELGKVAITAALQRAGVD